MMVTIFARSIIPGVVLSEGLLKHKIYLWLAVSISEMRR